MTESCPYNNIYTNSDLIYFLSSIGRAQPDNKHELAANFSNFIHNLELHPDHELSTHSFSLKRDEEECHYTHINRVLKKCLELDKPTKFKTQESAKSAESDKVKERAFKALKEIEKKNDPFEQFQATPGKTVSPNKELRLGSSTGIIDIQNP